MIPEGQPRRRVLGGLLAAGAVTLGAAPAASAAASSGGAARPTVVLVHGVFADASGWNDVIARLLKAGFPVIAPANPLRDLAGDSAYVSSVVGSVSGPVILVGHSYGGEVITNAGRGHSHVKALVYVGAFAPDEGESALDLAGMFPGSKLEDALVIRPFPLPDGTTGRDGYIDPAKFREVFAADLPASVTRLMAATQRPGSVGGLSSASGVPAWKSLPSWYVIPTADQVIPAAVQRFMAERARSKVVEVKGSSHVVMMSHPDVVVRQIVAAHRATR
ncbi:Alpha/beta hydrolase family protein [Streptomyces graminofaciens]|uniref:Alpha/beta hydrolase family protein n=1 Tax=Streptomyces graminofaciens TaxID=68212 RepID=A0ABM7F1F8_9ACTN|nr:alpha/beta hydrolase [Streptomyces graminofaciens]BBC29578.1 Alpha/beta hydrolase family protein [Streptomyces graminofaciens]